MIRKHKRKFTLLTLATIIALGVISRFEQRVVEEAEVPEELRYLDAFMNNIDLTAMDETGKPAYRLTAERLERYSDSGTSFITRPVFHLKDADGNWQVTARQGTLDKDNIWLRLEEDVVFRQLDDEDPVTVRTRVMNINTRTRIARTQEHVQLERQDMSLTADGMVYEHNRRFLKLLANVRGQYVPE